MATENRRNRSRPSAKLTDVARLAFSTAAQAPVLQRWAYAFAYPSSAHRTRALIDNRGPHGSLDGLPPVSRVHTSVGTLDACRHGDG